MSQKSNKLSTEILTALGVSTARLKSAVITLTAGEEITIQATYIKPAKESREFENPLSIKYFKLKEIK